TTSTTSSINRFALISKSWPGRSPWWCWEKKPRASKEGSNRVRASSRKRTPPDHCLVFSMALEFELEWWRPREAEAESSHETDQADPGEAWLPFWCVMAFTGVLLLSPQNYFTVLQPLRPALLITIIGLLSYVADRWSRGLPVINWSRETGLIAA